MIAAARHRSEMGHRALAGLVPRVETSRLVLREPRLSDLDSVAAFYASDRSVFVGGPLTADAAFGYLQASAGAWVLRGYSWWVIEERGTGAVVGRCGIGFPPELGEPELGWQVFDGFEGRGLAFEAVNAARSHAAHAWGLTRPCSLIDARNRRSRALAERLGATVEREIPIEDGTDIVYRHPEVTA